MEGDLSLNIGLDRNARRYRVEVIAWHDGDLDFAWSQDYPLADRGFTECMRGLDKALWVALHPQGVLPL
jgi:hypothetical protein